MLAVKTMAKEGAAIAKSLGCDVSIDVDAGVLSDVAAQAQHRAGSGAWPPARTRCHVHGAARVRQDDRRLDADARSDGVADGDPRKGRGDCTSRANVRIVMRRDGGGIQRSNKIAEAGSPRSRATGNDRRVTSPRTSSLRPDRTKSPIRARSASTAWPSLFSSMRSL